MIFHIHLYFVCLEDIFFCILYFHICSIKRWLGFPIFGKFFKYILLKMEMFRRAPLMTTYTYIILSMLYKYKCIQRDGGTLSKTLINLFLDWWQIAVVHCNTQSSDVWFIVLLHRHALGQSPVQIRILIGPTGTGRVCPGTINAWHNYRCQQSLTLTEQQN